MANVRFFGAVNTYSGYGNAVKNFAQAFSISNVKTNFVFPENNKQAHRTEAIQLLNNYTGRCNVDFYLHGPPYGRHKSSAAHKIAYFYWEADKLPKQWTHSLNQVNEIWAPCQLVKDACLRTNFKGKIKIVPTPCEDWETDKKIFIPSNIEKNYFVSDHVFKFYSIFQWHTRKGYKELLSSYYKTFTDNDNVILILKVNALNIEGNTKDSIRLDILDIKKKLNQKYYPPVYVIVDIISEESIRALHNTGDCYVSPHHGEGWGMPIHDAMYAGKNIITTKFGGVTEYLDDDSAHIVKHSLGPVNNMEWNKLYASYQNWAYPSINHLSNLMRDVYVNHLAYNNKRENAAKIARDMNISSIAQMINKELG